MWECEWWRQYKTTTIVELRVRENFPYRRSLTEHELLEGIKSGKFFGYVQCGIEVPENLKTNFVYFLPIIENTLVSKNNFGDFTKTYVEDEGIFFQPQKMLLSCSTSQNGTLITLLLLFYLQLGLVVTKKPRFVDYTPKKFLNRFIQAGVNARMNFDENPNSSVVTETVKLRANSSYVYQSLGRSRHAVTNYLGYGKTHTANNSKRFKKADHVNNSLYEVELAKAQIEHKGSFIVGFLNLQYAKLRMHEL